MARPRHEPAAETLPEVVESLDLLRTALLAADVAALTADQNETAFEELRLRRLGDDAKPALATTKARARGVEAVAGLVRTQLALSELTVPSPVEDAAVLHGRVIDDGTAAEKVTVVALDDDGKEVGKAVTDERGEYVLEIPMTERTKVKLEVRKGRTVLPIPTPVTRLDPDRVAFHELVVKRG